MDRNLKFKLSDKDLQILVTALVKVTASNCMFREGFHDQLDDVAEEEWHKIALGVVRDRDTDISGIFALGRKEGSKQLQNLFMMYASTVGAATPEFKPGEVKARWHKYIRAQEAWMFLACRQFYP